MGRQLTFYLNDAVEAEFFSFAQSIGLEMHDVPGAPHQTAIGFTRPPLTRWPFSEAFVQYARTDGSLATVRLWYDPIDEKGKRKSEKIAHSFELLRRFVRRTSRYYAGPAMWVHKRFIDEFESRLEKREQERTQLLHNNRRTVEEWVAREQDES